MSAPAPPPTDQRQGQPQGQRQDQPQGQRQDQPQGQRQDQPQGQRQDQPYDPLRLCVYATVALIAWALGPVAVLGFAGLGFVGYLRARRAGLTRSKCLLRDTRLVLAYLGVLALAGAGGIANAVWHAWR